MRIPDRWKVAVTAMVLVALCAAGCTVGREPSRVATTAPPATGVPHVEQLIATQDTTTDTTTPDTAPVDTTPDTAPADTTPDTAPVDTEPETTTTTAAPGQDCGHPNTLRVQVQGSDGQSITGQVSADFKRYGQKVNGEGQVIPNDQYSQTVWLDGSTSSKDLCFTGFPDAQIFLEIYPKDFVDGAFALRSTRYGSAMWHGVWPGAGQKVYISVPLVCTAQHKGITGTIEVTATENDQPIGLNRLVAWSRTEGSMRLTPGFSVADAAQYGTPEVKTLEQVAAGQSYFVQVQTTSGRVATIEPVPVDACTATNMNVAITKKDCTVTIGDEDPKPCRLPSATVG